VPLDGRHIVLGVSGGIASYKSCIIARRLVELGATVWPVLTRNAARFVAPATFEGLTGQTTLSSLWTPGTALDHVRLPARADLMIVAPATANLLARAAQGMADDLLSAMLLAADCPVLMAPAMNDQMYSHPATQANLATLSSRGVLLVGPASGPLAEGPSDRPGRMVEPDSVVAHARRLLGPGSLKGLKVVVTAGPTREPIDPIRFVSNRSSGKMGYRVAEAAWYRGAEVHLISGPSTVPPPEGATVEPVETTAQMGQAVARALPGADVLVMAAAPADFRPAQSLAAKRPRSEGDLSLAMVATDDILQATSSLRPSGATIVGFALETGDALIKGRDKLARKQLDLIVVNDALEEGAGFEVDTNRVTILDRRGGEARLPLASKSQVADSILDAIESYRDADTTLPEAAD